MGGHQSRRGQIRYGNFGRMQTVHVPRNRRSAERKFELRDTFLSKLITDETGWFFLNFLRINKCRNHFLSFFNHINGFRID